MTNDLNSIASLAAKISTLDLDDAERSALAAILSCAVESSGDDVEGFGASVPGSLGLEPSSFRQTKTGRSVMTHPYSFKGSDEELQAIIDWLGSLELK